MCRQGLEQYVEVLVWEVVDGNLATVVGARELHASAKRLGKLLLFLDELRVSALPLLLADLVGCDLARNALNLTYSQFLKQNLSVQCVLFFWSVIEHQERARVPFADVGGLHRLEHVVG